MEKDKILVPYTYPISYTAVAIPISGVEWNTFGTFSGWASHYVYTVTLTSCIIYNADGGNYNNVLIIGY